jgi:hypothetical protein
MPPLNQLKMDRYVARMCEMKVAYKILVGQYDEKRTLGGTRRDEKY